jgi:ribose-phosphate pyrophosphokinase
MRGADVYVIQPTGPPVNENLIELLLLLDACRRAGADRVTAVVPYFGYARQDRRAGARQPIGARLAAEAIASAGASRLVAMGGRRAGPSDPPHAANRYRPSHLRMLNRSA